MKAARVAFERFALMNIDVVLIYATISLITALTFKLIPSRAFALILANVGFIIASYILNVVADHAEDSVNGRRALPLSKLGVTMVCVVLLGAFTVTYGVQGGLPFLALGAVLSLASVWYSFPRGYRLKNLFLIKNAVPSTCWYLTLVTLFYIGGGMYYYTFPQVLFGFIPFLILFFGFEIMWDLPDRAGDAHAGVRTFPTLIGFWGSKAVVCLLFLSVLVSIPTALDKAAVGVIMLFILAVPERAKKLTYHLFLTTLMVLAWIGYAVVIASR